MKRAWRPLCAALAAAALAAGCGADSGQNGRTSGAGGGGGPVAVNSDYALLFDRLPADQANALRAGLVRGHLAAALELAERGQAEPAARHLSHVLSDLTPPNGRDPIASAVGAHLDRLGEAPPEVVLDASARRIETRLNDATEAVALGTHAQVLRALARETARSYTAATGTMDTDRERFLHQSAWGYLVALDQLFAQRRADYAAQDAAAADRLGAAIRRAGVVFPDPLSASPPAEPSVRAATTQVDLALDPFL